MFLRRFAPLVLASGLMVCALPAGTAHAATIVRAKAGNGSIATAQLVGLDPVLVLRQKPGNNTLATAQPVSPTYMARDVVGSLTRGHPNAFFGFGVADGTPLHFVVSAKVPAKQFPELLLYDPNGNLVAVAAGNGSNGSDSVIDFTVPDGDGGTWTAEVTGSVNVPVKERFFPYDLRVTPVNFSTDVRGHHGPKDVPGFYAIEANAGDTLHVVVVAQKPATQFPELLLYDPNGNLVAVAAGNGSNGSDAVIEFTIPPGDSGAWTAEVVGSQNVPDQKKNVFPYDLTIQGATGAGPVIPK